MDGNIFKKKLIKSITHNFNNTVINEDDMYLFGVNNLINNFEGFVVIENEFNFTNTQPDEACDISIGTYTKSVSGIRKAANNRPIITLRGVIPTNIKISSLFDLSVRQIGASILVLTSFPKDSSVNSIEYGAQIYNRDSDSYSDIGLIFNYYRGTSSGTISLTGSIKSSIYCFTV